MSDTLHPLADLLLSSWAQESGIEPDLLRSYVLGDLPIPQDLAEEIQRVLGVPVPSWKAVQGKPAIKPLAVTKSAPSAANAAKERIQGKSGKPFTHVNAVSKWLAESGHNVQWLADQIGEKRGTLSAWMTGRNAVPPRVIDKVQKLSGGRITAPDWPKRQEG